MAARARWRGRRCTRFLYTLWGCILGGLLTVGCEEDGPAGPGSAPPTLAGVSPAVIHPHDSPAEIVLSGEGLAAATVSGPPYLFLEPQFRSDTELRLRAGFGGGVPGPAWIKVAHEGGRDSIQVTVEGLSPGDSLTETRALWVSRFEYGSAQDIQEILGRAAEAGFNLVYLQVRGRADAFYRSGLEPWAANLSGVLGQDPGWDPLDVAVVEARRHGIELHAWINAFTGWAGSSPPPVSEPLHAFLAHPDWVMVAEDGTAMPYGSGSRWLTPGHPGVRARLAAVAADILRGYHVEGIHLDFIRYPSTEYSFDAPSLAAFDSLRALEPGLDYSKMRRRFVNWAVREVRDSMRAVDPRAELSAAVWGVYKNDRGWSGVSTGLHDVLQDAREWDRGGSVDALVPMVYWTMTSSYGSRLDFAYLADEHASSIGGPAFIGVYVPGMTGAELTQHLERVRMSGAEGMSVFSYSSLESGGLWGALRSWAFFWPARRADADQGDEA